MAGWFIILMCIIVLLLIILIIACIVLRSRGQMYPGLCLCVCLHAYLALNRSLCLSLSRLYFKLEILGHFVVSLLLICGFYFCILYSALFTKLFGSKQPKNKHIK